MMVQTGSLLLGLLSDYKEDVVVTKIETADFSNEWRPGDTVRIEACCEQLRPEGAWLSGEVRGAGALVARSRFLLMNVGLLVPSGRGPVTFHENFMRHFQIRQKISDQK